MLGIVKKALDFGKSLTGFGGKISDNRVKRQLAKEGDKVQIENNASKEYIAMLNARNQNSYNAVNRNWFDSMVDGLNRLVFPSTAFPFVYLLWVQVIKDPKGLMEIIGTKGLIGIIGTLLGVRQIGKKIATSQKVEYVAVPPAVVEKTAETHKPSKKTITTNSKIPKVIKFVKDYKDVCLKLKEQYGIPALGVMAHCALETGWGEHILKGFDKHGKTISTNNMFNIKSSKSWHGEKAVKKVWEVSEGVDIFEKSAFRVYGNKGVSFLDYANLLLKNKRYSRVMESTSVEEYAKNLYKCGYMTDDKAPEKIISISEMFNLV